MGSNFDDILIGDNGNSNFNGRAGDDVFDMGAGTDRVTTGSGADTVLFAAGHQGPTVIDFEDDVDTLNLSGMGFASLADAQAAFADFGGGTQMMMGGDHLILLGISAAELADDIDLGIFV